MSHPASARAPLPRLLALTGAATGLILYLLSVGWQLTLGPRAEELRPVYARPGFLLNLLLDGAATLALTALIIYVCTRLHEENNGALPVAARRRVQGLLALAVVAISLGMQLIWAALFPVLIMPLVRWGFTHYRPYGGPLLMQGVGIVQAVIAGLLICAATLAYARRIAPGLAHDERERPMTPAPAAAAVVFTLTWLVLQLQLIRPAYGFLGHELIEAYPGFMLAILAAPLAPTVIVWLAVRRPLRALQPWRAAPGRAVLAALGGFISAQVIQGATALALGYGLGPQILKQAGIMGLVVTTLVIYLGVLLPVTRAFIRLFYRNAGLSSSAPAQA